MAISHGLKVAENGIDSLLGERLEIGAVGPEFLFQSGETARTNPSELSGAVELQPKILVAHMDRRGHQVVCGRKRGAPAVRIDQGPVFQVGVSVADCEIERDAPRPLPKRFQIVFSIAQRTNGLKATLVLFRSSRRNPSNLGEILDVNAPT